MENNEKKELKISTPTALIIMGLLIMIGIIISKNPSSDKVSLKENQQETKTEKNTYPENVSPIDKNDHTRGNLETAEIEVITYSDLECPVCKSFHIDMRNKMEKYSGKIFWVYRQYPIESLHSQAREEARATECIAKIKDNESFWKYIDLIYDNTTSNDGLDLEMLPIFAEKVGVSKEKFNDCMTNQVQEMDNLINEDMNNIYNEIKARGTPYSVVITKDNKIIEMAGYSKEYLNSVLTQLLEK